MPTGQLESFVVEKGFGFIVPDTGKGKVYAQIGQFKGGEEDIAKLVTGGGGQLISYVLDPEKKMVKTALQWNLKGDADPEPEPNINKGDGRGATGRMKNFEPSKGFGFIVPDGGGENVFCHARQFDGADVDDIMRDDRVCYDTEYDEKKGKTKASRWCREEGRQQSRDAGKGGRNGDRRGRSRSRSRGYRPAYGAPPAYGHPGMPHPGYGMPPPGYGMPPPGYGMPHQPPPGYGGPPPGYGAPPGMYGPAPGGKGGPYGAPSPYGAPPAAYGAQPPHGYGGPPGPYGAPPAAATAARAPAQQSPPLPADWEQIHDPASGKPYYHNRVTHETSWTLPAVPVGNSWALPAAAAAAAAAAPAATPAARPSLPLPQGFEQATDPSSGKPYFVNTKTGETSWTPPAAAGGEAPPAAKEVPPSKGDWDQMTDPASGKPYYVNRSTRETSWTIPGGAGEGAPVAAAQPVAAATKEHASSSPADWEELKDPARGRFYYRHRKTGETSWTPSSSSPREA